MSDTHDCYGNPLPVLDGWVWSGGRDPLEGDARSPALRDENGEVGIDCDAIGIGIDAHSRWGVVCVSIAEAALRAYLGALDRWRISNDGDGDPAPPVESLAATMAPPRSRS